MENLDIEKIITDNFYKMIQDENNPKETVQKHIKEIQKGLDIIKQNEDLEILKTLYIIKENIYKDLNKTNKKIVLKDNKGLFNNITMIIIFFLGYKKSCYWIRMQSKNETDRHIVLEVPEEFADRVIYILNVNYKNWEAVFKIEIA